VVRIDFVTLFPEWIKSGLAHSILARAASNEKVSFSVVSPRDFCYDQHHKVDDTPYGGHPGMLLRVEPVALAIESLPVSSKRAIVFTEPSGIPFTQKNALELAEFEQITFVCGHYEGIDHRAEETFATHVFSIGDYVLTNGEFPAMVMADAVVRLIPGVLGSSDSLVEDSFSEHGLSKSGLSAPNYTRPVTWRGKEVPSVLRSGNHQEIEKWRKSEGEKRTRARRSDLIE
jgi:tRNA (guanine37-N1)-methyltransferase